MSPDDELTIGTLVTLRPVRARLFESLGLDYCCGGRKPLTVACRERGLDAEAVLKLLQSFDEQVTEPSGRDWAAVGLTELVDHIEQTHHAYLKIELPRLASIGTRVAARHGSREPRVIELQNTVAALVSSLAAHLADEEEHLFPACRRLERSGDVSDNPKAASDVVGRLTRQHGAIGALLGQIRDLTGGYTPPAGACVTHQVLYASLADLAENTHRHVHKEESILFPKAIEAARCASRSPTLEQERSS